MQVTIILKVLLDLVAMYEYGCALRNKIITAQTLSWNNIIAADKTSMWGYWYDLKLFCKIAKNTITSIFVA